MNMKCAELDHLFDAIQTLSEKDEFYDFFQDLCTIDELHEMGQRFEVARLLDHGENYDAIRESTGVMICTPFTGQLVKGDFLCAIPMNSKNIALTCIGKDNIRKHLKVFPKGVFA